MANDSQSDLDKVTPLSEWFRRVGLPSRSGRRLIASGNGPVLTELTPQRHGVRERHHLEWLDARAEKP